ncbi:hypothetical protein GFS60_01913 [Rhodococcus sp. WAY2]|nr:hypothetical protein GFS60_01913 [Rhodococcus sp. WAY2]
MEGLHGRREPMMRATSLRPTWAAVGSPVDIADPPERRDDTRHVNESTPC